MNMDIWLNMFGPMTQNRVNSIEPVWIPSIT